jgi:hypothetical protein
MLNPLLPRSADNAYRGYTIALWIFGFVVLWKAAIAVAVIFNGHDAALHADGIPLESFGEAGARAFLALDAAWGLEGLMLCGLCAIALFRYRTLIPLMFAVLLLEHVLRKVIFYVMPIASVGASPSLTINLILIGLLVSGLLLSLLQRKAPLAEAAA